MCFVSCDKPAPSCLTNDHIRGAWHMTEVLSFFSGSSFYNRGDILWYITPDSLTISYDTVLVGSNSIPLPFNRPVAYSIEIRNDSLVIDLTPILNDDNSQSPYWSLPYEINADNSQMIIDTGFATDQPILYFESECGS